MIEALDIETIIKSPFNVRDTEVEDPAFDANIKELGVLQPPVVRKINGIPQAVLGWTRIQAAKKAKQKKINCDVREMTDEEALLASFSENEFQHSLSPTNRAIIVAQLVGEKELLNGIDGSPKTVESPYTKERLGKFMGVNGQAVSKWLEPLRLQPETRELLEAQKIPQAVAAQIRQYATTPQAEVEIAKEFAKIDEDKREKQKRTLPRPEAVDLFQEARHNELPPEELIKRLKAMRDPEVQPEPEVEEEYEPSMYEGGFRYWPLVLRMEDDLDPDYYRTVQIDEDVIELLEKWKIDIFEKLNDILRDWLKLNGFR